MDIYNYDAAYFYTHVSTLNDSDRDPLNPEQYLIPAGATTEPPPEVGQNQAARFVNGAWAVVPDFAGVAYYLDDTKHVMTERGVALPDGATLEKPQSVIDKELQTAKNGLVNKINTIRDARIAVGVLFNDVSFDSDPAAQQNITGAVVLAQLALMQSAAFSVQWIANDNSIVTLDAMGVIGLGQAVAQYKSAKIIEARGYKDQILNANTSLAEAQLALEAYQQLGQAS